MEHQTTVSQLSAPDRINLNLEQVKKIANDLYGIIVVNIKELNGYDDKNYFISESEVENNGFILKIINLIDSKKPEIFEAQSLLLEHLANKGIQCPNPIRTKDGRLFEKYKLNSGEHIVRLLRYIDGVILPKIPFSPNLFYQIGQITANLDNAMKTFEHEAYKNYKSLWMLESVPQIYQFMDAIKDKKWRELVEKIVEEFSERILPLSKTFQRGLIHGDINEQNIIVDEQNKIKAIIDYGDCHIGCYLYELAITMTYMMLLAKDIRAGGHVLAGYSSVKEIDEQEYNSLKLCIEARLCQSLVIGAYTNQQDPKNTYVLVTAEYGWTLLEKLWNQSNEELLKLWKNSTVITSNSRKL